MKLHSMRGYPVKGAETKLRQLSQCFIVIGGPSAAIRTPLRGGTFEAREGRTRHQARAGKRNLSDCRIPLRGIRAPLAVGALKQKAVGRNAPFLVFCTLTSSKQALLPPEHKKTTELTFGGLCVCGGSRIRTGDPMLAKHVLYQLSYTPG